MALQNNILTGDGNVLNPWQYCVAVFSGRIKQTFKAHNYSSSRTKEKRKEGKTNSFAMVFYEGGLFPVHVPELLSAGEDDLYEK